MGKRPVRYRQTFEAVRPILVVANEGRIVDPTLDDSSLGHPAADWHRHAEYRLGLSLDRNVFGLRLDAIRRLDDQSVHATAIKT